MSEGLAKEAFTDTGDCEVTYSIVGSDLGVLTGGLETVLSINVDGKVSVLESAYTGGI